MGARNVFAAHPTDNKIHHMLQKPSNCRDVVGFCLDKLLQILQRDVPTVLEGVGKLVLERALVRSFGRLENPAVDAHLQNFGITSRRRGPPRRREGKVSRNLIFLFFKLAPLRVTVLVKYSVQLVDPAANATERFVNLVDYVKIRRVIGVE